VLAVCIDDYANTMSMFEEFRLEQHSRDHILIQFSTGTPQEARDSEAGAISHGTNYLDGELHQTDNIFLAEVAYTDAKAVDTHTAEVFVDGVTEPLAAYDSGDLLSLSQATTAGIYVSIPEFLSMLYKKGVAIGLGDEEVVALIKLLRR
jgi:hypothetical protein|tara:strand:+ start:753 stop:1199 length:447 start_codon:yes stop_codon:yes gene_type:complete